MEIKFQSNTNAQIKTRSTDGLLTIIRYLDRLYANSIEYFDGVITFDIGTHTDSSTSIDIKASDIIEECSVEEYICLHLSIILRNIANSKCLTDETYICTVSSPDTIVFTAHDKDDHMVRIGVPHIINLYATDVHSITHPVALYIFILFRDIMGIPVDNGIG